MKKQIGSILFILVLFLTTGAFAQDTTSEEPAMSTDEDLPKWSASGALGFTMTTGNSETLTLNGGLEGSRLGIWTNHFLKGGVNYGNVLYPEADSRKEITNNYFGNYRFEGYYLANKKPYFWVKAGAESDRFQGYWQRYTLDAGPGYNFFGKSKYVLKVEAGYLWSLTEWIEKRDIDPDEDEIELHNWEPTHNGLARLIASVPVMDYMLFTEEALFYMNIMNEDDYVFTSVSALNFKINSRFSFTTSLKINYVNEPGAVDDLDENGVVKTDAVTGDNLVERADNTDMVWTNSLVISIF